MGSYFHSLAAKLKLSWEGTNMEEMEIVDLSMKESSAKAISGGW